MSSMLYFVASPFSTWFSYRFIFIYLCPTSRANPISNSFHSSTRRASFWVLTLSYIVLCTKLISASLYHHRDKPLVPLERVREWKNKFLTQSELSRSEKKKKRRRLQNKEKELRLPFKLWNKSSRTFWGLCEVRIHHKFTDLFVFFLPRFYGMLNSISITVY